MVIKSFLVYIGVFFACAIALVMIVKNFAPGIAVSGKKPTLQGGLSAIGASAAAYLSTLFATHAFAIFWVFATIFLVLGIIHIQFFHKRYFYFNQDNKNGVIIGEILFMLAVLFFIVVVFSSLEYFLENRNFLFFPMLMSMLTFFIPLSVYHTFDAAYKIPESRFPLWQYPNSPVDLPDEKPNEKLLVIAFELSKTPADRTTTNFRAKGPETMKLGDLYYHFINDYNELHSETPILYSDKDHGVQEWGLRIKTKWYQSARILDPELTIRENRIKENSVILCERI